MIFLASIIAWSTHLQQFRTMLDHAHRLEMTCARADWMVRATMTTSSILFESLTTDEWYFWDGSSCTLSTSTGLSIPEDDCAGPNNVAPFIHLPGCDHAAVTQSWLVPGLITIDTLTGRRHIPGDAISVEVVPDSREFHIIWTSQEPIFITGTWYERSGE